MRCTVKGIVDASIPDRNTLEQEVEAGSLNLIAYESFISGQQY